MSQKISQKPKTDLAQDALNHNRDLLLALSRAAQAVQQARTTDEIYRAVGDQIKFLGCEVILLMVNEDRQSLTIVYVSYTSDLVRQAEKMIGTSALGYRIALSNDNIYARNIAAGKAEYIHSAKEHFIDALPTILHPLADPLMSILKIEQGILAPLHVEGETLGLMMVSGLELNEGDVPAMESFAGQIAISLHNIQLAQKIQLELIERKQAELGHEVLLEIMQGLATTQDLQDFLCLVHHSIAKIIHAENFFVTLYNPDTAFFEEVYSVDKFDPPAPPSRLENSISAYVFRSGLPLLLTQARFDELAVRGEVKLVGTNSKSWLGVPLKTASEIIGVMVVQDYDQPNRYSERDTEFLAAIAGQVALAIERKQAEENLTESEAELRALFACMQDAVLVLDRDGFYRKIAPTNPNLLIKPSGDLLGKNLTDIFPAAQAKTFLAAIRQVLDTQQSARIEYELSIAGRQAWFFTSISPMDTDNTLWVARDVTERKQADAALRESDERYHSLFDRMMDGAYRSTHEGRFVDVNPAMVRMFGYASREEMLAVDIKNELYFAPQERNSHILDTGREEMDIYRMRRKDGSEIWVEDHSSYVHDEQGNITYHEGMLRDITQRKQAEDELRYMKESLESANYELHQFLMQEQVLARTDELTGLFNRRHFFELAEREFSSALRYGRPLAILMFDADYLKQVNDTFGHTVGDKILMEIGRVASAQIRAVDVLARYGGDEFILLLPQTNTQQALLIAERICKSAEELRVSTSKGDATVTLSIGVADLLCAPTNESIERVIQCADKALYTAKQAGRNRAVMFELEYH